MKTNLRLLFAGGRLQSSLRLIVAAAFVASAQTAQPSPPSSLPTPVQAQKPAHAAVAAEELNAVDQIPVSDSIKIPVLDFKDTDIRDVLRAVGMQYNVNIFLEPEVTGAVSLYLTNVTVPAAIDFIVKRQGYSYAVENDIVKVFKYNPPEPPPPPRPPIVFKLDNGVLDIDIKDVPARDVARLFAENAGMNVVVESQQDKRISSHLIKIDPEQALSVLFESNGFEVANQDGVYYVAQRNWGDQQSGSAAGQGGSSRLRRLSITVSPRGLVSMEVNGASLDEVIRSIATQSGIDIFIYDNISGAITAKVDSVPVDDAFRFLLQNTKFTFWKDRAIYFIGSREMSEQKTTVVIPLKHIMAEEESIAKLLPPSISKDAVIKYDNEHNAIVVIGSFDVVASTQEFIEKIDKPVPQVLIEALVVDFNISKIRQFGLSVFTGSAGDSSGYWNRESFIPDVELKPGRKNTLYALKQVMRFLGVDKVVELPKNFRASIHALEAANVVKVHSTPQIATINGNSASIIIGETRYYRLTKQTKAPIDNESSVIGTDERFEVIKFNNQLEVTPWVMDEGYVTVKIRPEFNIPRSGGDGNQPPNVDTRVLESMVRLKNGQTIVLGGQRQTEDAVDGRGVPILSSIPVLGWLFSHKTFTKVETQMMIFLTPHVYYGDENAVSPDDFFGRKIKRMLEKHDPEKFGNRLKEKRERRKRERAARDRVQASQTAEPEDQQTVTENKKRGFPWPWKLFGRKEKAVDED